MSAGLFCAAKLESGEWRRGQILDPVAVQLKLIDVGSIVTLPFSNLYKLEDQWSVSAMTAMAFCCSLWGLRPAGHLTDWSGSSTDTLKDLVTGRNLYFQTYHAQDEVYQVRLYYEYLELGGPLGFDQIKTDSVNDALMEAGLALKSPPRSVPLTVQPIMRSEWSWPICLTLPPELEAKVVWVSDDGRLYFHHRSGPSHHLEEISRLLNWYYAGSKADDGELEHWIVGEPCIARYAEDGEWYRAVVIETDDEERLGKVRFVDYGNDSSVKYADMRRNLFCFDYAVQAYCVQLERYPGPVQPVKTEELELLHDLLVNKTVRMSIKYPDGPGELPVASNLTNLAGGRDWKDVLDQLRPAGVIPQPVAPQTATSSEEEEEEDPPLPFTFDIQLNNQADPFRNLSLPVKTLLPVRFIRQPDATTISIQPNRHGSPLNEAGVPPSWYAQIDTFNRIQDELQKAAPSFPLMLIGAESPSERRPCAFFRHENYKWYRGLTNGRQDNGDVNVHLIDVDLDYSVPTGRHLRLLPNEYLAVSRSISVLNF